MTRYFLKGEAQARFTQDRIDLIPHLSALCEQNRAEFVVVCGDMFDSNHVAPQTIMRATEKLRRFAYPMFILPGNHDPLNAASVYESEAFKSLPDHIQVIRDQSVHRTDKLPGIEVVGAPWFNKKPTTDLCAQLLDSLDPVATGVTRIVLAHGQLDTLMPDTSHPACISKAAIKKALNDNKLHYVALGDRHSVTDADDSGRIWYSGTPVATDVSEIEPNKVLVVDASGGIDPRASVEVTDSGGWQFLRIEENTDSTTDLERLAAALNNIENKERASVTLALSGALSLSVNAELERLIDRSRGLFASLRIDELRTDLSVVPDQLEYEKLALSGYARASWEELADAAQQSGENAIAAQQSGENAIAARDALALMYRLADGGIA